MAWDEWFQDVAKDAVGKYVDKETMPSQGTLNFGALGQQGYYREGQPGTYGQQSGVGGMSTGVIVAGVAALLVVVLVLKG